MDSGTLSAAAGLDGGGSCRLTGIASPTLSKILNGRMELSAAVAARMETVFAVDAKALLEKQLQTSDSVGRTLKVPPKRTLI